MSLNPEFWNLNKVLILWFTMYIHDFCCRISVWCCRYVSFTFLQILSVTVINNNSKKNWSWIWKKGIFSLFQTSWTFKSVSDRICRMQESSNMFSLYILHYVVTTVYNGFIELALVIHCLFTCSIINTALHLGPVQ